MKPTTRYTPTEKGFSISGSSEVFNRTLYGSHKNDENPERFLTFAGDAPQFMGAVSDWLKSTVSYYAKCGVLNSGLAITAGQRSRFYYSPHIDQTSKWFHDSEDIVARFNSGWMEYELSQMSAWFPDVRVKIEAYPLLPDDGYIIHYNITTDQHVHFVAGFGAITDVLCRFEYKGEPRRYFSPENTKGNTVEIGDRRATVTHTDGKTMRIGASFPATFALGSAKAMSEPYASTFLTSSPENDDDRVVRISAPIEPSKAFDGYLVAIYNSDDETLDKWLNMQDPIAYVKSQIYAKLACIDVSTPEMPLDMTVAPTVIALDSSWHKDSFHHGAFAYHAPFLGWRNWYAPTALGWGERVAKTMEKYFALILKGDVEKERVWYDYTPIPKGQNRFDRRYHYQENPVGRLPSCFDSNQNPEYGPYNMQECALDMMLYYIEWSGDLDIAKRHFDDMVSMVEWERRTFDPDDDGLYQNLLNTWISDGHNYNGAGCAQSSAYNYRANLVLSKIAEKIGRDGEVFRKRAEKIKKALNEKLWLANDGVIAESLDTVGNCLIHPAVELPSVYHVMDQVHGSELIDGFKAYRTLKFTENHIKSIETAGTGGRLSYSSGWLPKQYSNCGIFPAENAHLALVYFKLGLKEMGKKILDGISDCYFTGRNPGMAAHVQSPMGTCDLGDMDFTDVSSTYLRLIVEGLYGIRINSLDGVINIAPGFPSEWEHASLNLKDISLTYSRKAGREVFNFFSERSEKKLIRIPMRASNIEAVTLDGEPIPYEIVAAPNNSFIFVTVDKIGRFVLRVMHGNEPMPTVSHQNTVLENNKIVFEVKDGSIADVFDVSEALEDVTVVNNKVYARATAAAGDHTLFIRVTEGKYDGWLAADYVISTEEKPEAPLKEEKTFEEVDISNLYNCNMTELHEQAYIEPRPKGYSMGMYQNGRYSHNWNQKGRNVVYIDDSFFRNSGGKVYTPSGIPFATPGENENLACVSIFEVFPTEITVPLSKSGEELAILFVASACCLHTGVENARITVTYTDGTTSETKLTYPEDVDDWLTSALTTRSEIFYFNDFNHATVKRIRINPEKELANVKIEAIANELILGIAGISISR
ncbi:MAG: hypothetical protein J6Q68_03840 [Clostridia bacterium]|nr:hypothetical protein [Clostridia bacterium]